MSNTKSEIRRQIIPSAVTRMTESDVIRIAVCGRPFKYHRIANYMPAQTSKPDMLSFLLHAVIINGVQVEDIM